MTIRSQSPSPHDPKLLNATVRYESGLYAFLLGFLPEQLDYLCRLPDEDAREIAESKNCLLLPSLGAGRA